MVKRLLTAIFAGICLSACGGGGGNSLPTGPSPVSTTVEFTFTARLSDSTQALDCTGQVHVHPSWWGFAPATMNAVSTDLFRLLFEQVPIGRHSVRLTAPEGCGFESLAANGLALSRVDGAFPFTAHPDGSVAP